jgi:hypothetical protein
MENYILIPSKNNNLTAVWVDTDSKRFRRVVVEALVLPGRYAACLFIQCDQKVAVNFQNVLEVMSTSVYTGLNLFNDTSSTHTNPVVRTIGNYTLDDLHQQYKRYINKRTKHILL